MRLVVDMNLSVGWGDALRAAGFDALHWSEVGSPAAPDDEITEWARVNGACVLTRDLDFAAAVTRSGAGAPSVIQLRIDRVRLDAHLPIVRRCLAVYGPTIEQGAIVTLDEERTRVRALDPDPTR